MSYSLDMVHENTSGPIKIRAHHLLCLQGYQGYGYSKDFVENINKVIRQVRTNPDLIIEVTAQNDIICAGCPYAGKVHCEKNEDSQYTVHAMDLIILEEMNLIEGASGTLRDLTQLVNAMFRSKSTLLSICGHCQWQQKCLWYRSHPD